MKINSTTYSYEKNSEEFEQLKSIVEKIAKDNDVYNIKRASISLNPESGKIAFDLGELISKGFDFLTKMPSDHPLMTAIAGNAITGEGLFDTMIDYAGLKLTDLIGGPNAAAGGAVAHALGINPLWGAIAGYFAPDIKALFEKATSGEKLSEEEAVKLKTEVDAKAPEIKKEMDKAKQPQYPDEGNTFAPQESATIQ